MVRVPIVTHQRTVREIKDFLLNEPGRLGNGSAIPVIQEMRRLGLTFISPRACPTWVNDGLPTIPGHSSALAAGSRGGVVLAGAYASQAVSALSAASVFWMMVMRRLSSYW